MHDDAVKYDFEIARSYNEKIGSPFMDSLSGLVNHGFFHLSVEREIERHRRHGTPFSVGLVGIDGFSQFNERNGRIEGDRLLKNVAAAIERSIRNTDMAGRYQGDIFSILFVESSSEELFSAAERICDKVRSLPGSPTVSIGLADYSSDLSGPEELFMNAQAAMTLSKRKGKSRVLIYQKRAVPNNEVPPTVLLVDDEPKNLKLLRAMLTPLEYEVLQAENGRDALDVLRRVDTDLVLLDIMMPDMNGYETCRRIKNNPKTQMVPVVLVTALGDMESRIKGLEAGANDFLTKPVNRLELVARAKSLIKLSQTHNSLTSIENVLFSLARAVEAKDAYTQGHTERVANLSLAIGRKLKLPPQDMTALSYGGVMHDIGKIGIPNSILNKPGKLNDEEWAMMKKHPLIGSGIGKPLEKNLGAALQVIRYHHEKMDGSGYPEGLMGEEIPVVARIVGVADIYDALTTDRPYRKGMSKEKAIEIMRQEVEDGKLDGAITAKLIELVGGGQGIDGNGKTVC
jgi:putative two-component system response regulator